MTFNLLSELSLPLLLGWQTGVPFQNFAGLRARTMIQNNLAWVRIWLT